MDELIKIGHMDGIHEQSNRVYDIGGVAPTIQAEHCWCNILVKKDNITIEHIHKASNEKGLHRN